MNHQRHAWMIGALLLVCLGAPTAGGEPSPTAGESTQLPEATNLDFSLKDLAGKDVRLSDFKGKVIVLNLFATWCGPCRKEVPDLIKLQSVYPEDVAVIGIVLQDKFGQNVKTFAHEFGIRYPILDGNDHPGFEKAFGPFWALPTSILVDGDGRIRKKHQGQVTLQQLEREIRPLIPR